ncbi:MAG: cupin domain-containing protein [Xanthomonadales bacterium]|nr:cupin domain-containing protein [Xanthomonadales bacterium]
MNAEPGALLPGRFLEEYWQKQACLVRGALTDYQSPLDGDDLAGLACEAWAESRLVQGRYPEPGWTLRHGPFEEDDFAGLPESHWTLLVQDVEKHFPPLQSLLTHFDFLPSWRLDDVMVSYAARGGSVGPHVDQYDVFLLQVQGERLWQIASSFDPELLDPCPLNILKRFEAEQEWVVRPGDLLYLPPGVAHHGVALDECMTFSIGLRAPSTADLLLALGESLGSREDGLGRYADPDLRPGPAGLIDAAALDRLRTMVASSLEDDGALREFSGRFLTRFGLALEPANPEPDLDPASLAQALRDGARLVRNPWTRLAWTRHGKGARLFAAGEAVLCSAELAERLCRNPEPELFSSALSGEDLDAILWLVNRGHLLLED